MAAVNPDIWPMPSTRPQQIDRAQKGGSLSDFTKSGDYFMRELLTDIWDDINQQYGTDVQLPPGSTQ